MKVKDLLPGFLLVLFLISVGCGGGTGTEAGAPTANLVSISVTPASSSVPADITGQFTASGTYSDGTTRGITTQVTWTSSDPSVATIDGSGLATTAASGTTTIKASLGSIWGNTLFYINRATLSSISITPANPSVPVPNTKQFTASGIYSDGTTHVITTRVIWRSANTSVATVNSAGLATAVAPGTTAITAALYLISGSTTLTVPSATLSSISITPGNPSIPVGNTKQFAASGIYSDGTSYDITTQVTWTSSNTSVATVNSSGLATAIAAGSATITVTSGNISGNTTLAVTAATLSSISITPGNPSIPVGNTRQLAASGTYSDGTSHDITTQVTWKSSNTSVATVNSTGLAAAVAAGSATITATSGSILENTTLTVTAAGTISLAWDPPTTNTDGSSLTDLAGYKIYYGTASGTYDHSIDVKNVTTYVLTGLAQGQTYYVAAAAYDTSNNQSGLSNEVSAVPK